MGRPLFPKGTHYKNWALGNTKPGLAPATDVEDHAAQRAAINPMFYRTNLLKQERHVQERLEVLMKKLHQHESDKEGVEIGFWTMAFTSDVITDLAFGEPFGSLEAEKIHWVVEQMNGYFSMILYLDGLRRMSPALFNVLVRFLPKKVTEQRRRLGEFAQTKLNK